MSEPRNHASLESCIPGRARFRLIKTENLINEFDTIIEFLKGLSGVIDVVGSVETGGVLVIFDNNQLKIVDIIRLATEEGVFSLIDDNLENNERQSTEISEIGARIVGYLREIDQRINSATGGLIDGKTLIPLILFAIAIKRILSNRTRFAAPWYTLIWYAYSIFMHWHHPEKQSLETSIK